METISKIAAARFAKGHTVLYMFPQISTARESKSAVWRECHALDIVFVAGESGQSLAGFHVPKLQGRVMAARESKSAVGRESHALDWASVSAELAQFVPCGHFTQSERLVTPSP